MPVIPYARQSVSREDIEAVRRVLESDWLTQGPAIERFEAEVAAYCGAPHAVALASGTAGLHLACLAAGLGPGDVLWTSPLTFVASANAALYCGARVDFVDIDPRSCNMSIAALAEKLARAERSGALPKAILPVHFAGRPCDMRAIGELARRYGVRVIEDAAHALGAEGPGGRVGNCADSDMTVLSFHAVKIVTTAEGGMVLCRDAALAARLRSLRSHGITRDPARMEDRTQGAWYYEQQELGYHYRMTDVQAALGSSQLQRLGDFLVRRRELAQRYDRALVGLPLATPAPDPELRSAWHLYVVQLAAAGPVRRRVFDALRAADILVNVHYLPVHLQPFYRRLGFARGDFPVAEEYYERALTLPLFPALTDAEQDRVVAELARVLR